MPVEREPKNAEVPKGIPPPARRLAGGMSVGREAFRRARRAETNPKEVIISLWETFQQSVHY